MLERNRKKADEVVDHAGEPLRNEALVEAMRAVSVEDSPQSRAMLFQMMLDSTLVVMTPETKAATTRFAKRGEKLSLMTWSDTEGTVLAAFTSTAALLRHRPEGAQYVALPASALFEMADRAGTHKIVFDPGSSTTGFVTRAEIEALSRGRLPVSSRSEVVAAQTATRIGRPVAGLPPALRDAIRDGCRSMPVERAWLTMIQQGEQQPEIVVAVRFSTRDVAASMSSLVDQISTKAGSDVSHLRFLIASDALKSTLDSGAGEVLFPW